MRASLALEVARLLDTDQLEEAAVLRAAVKHVADAIATLEGFPALGEAGAELLVRLRGIAAA